jgi:hypothetical protein
MNKAGKMSWVGVDLNKDSKTFGEINVGGFRWNYWGADAPLVRYALAVSQGKRQEAAGLPATDVSRLRLSKNFAGAKIAPGVPRALWVELVNGGFDPYAQRNVNTKSGALLFALDQVDPLFFANSFDSYNDLGPAAVVPSYLANISGLSTSTWDTSPTEDQLKSAARTDLKQQMPNADKVFQLPAVQESFKSLGLGSANSLGALKDAYIAKNAPIIAQHGMSLPEAETIAGKQFDSRPQVQSFKDAMAKQELAFWGRNPKLLDDMVTKGIVKPTEAEQKILDAYRSRQQVAAR